MTKKKMGIISGICLIVILFIGISIGKQISYEKDVKKDINKVIANYRFITSYKLNGYLNSKMELNINKEFDKITFEEKQDAFKIIYNELNNSIIANAVHHNIKLDTSRLVKEHMVIANSEGKLYSFELDTLSVKKVDNNKTLGKKTLSDDEIVIKIHAELQKNKNISDLKQDIEEGYSYVYGKPNQPINITMVDNFFEKKLSEQYKEISEIFDKYLELLREQGIEPYYNYIYIKKTGNEYKSYQISEDKFELISLNEELNRNTIEENLAMLDKYDNKITSNGTYGGKTITETNNETSSQTSSQYLKEPSEDDKGFAWTAAIQEVKKVLKAPSTAKFPFSYYNQDIKEVDINTFVVNSYVDAENSFGAKIRTKFMVKIKKTGTNSYNVEDIKTYE